MDDVIKLTQGMKVEIDGIVGTIIGSKMEVSVDGNNGPRFEPGTAPQTRRCIADGDVRLKLDVPMKEYLELFRN